MTGPSFLLDVLLPSETVEVALERLRVSGRRPSETALALRELGAQLAELRPATSRLAGYLAERVADLDRQREWVDQDHLSTVVNAALSLASRQTTWPATLAALRPHRDAFGPDEVLAVVAWHSELARAGVPPHANGAGVVICLGALAGGAELGMTHLVWARACEQRSLAHAELHHRRAAELLRPFPEAADRYGLEAAARSFRSRFGLVRGPRTGGATGESVAGDNSAKLASLAVIESQAGDCYDRGDFVEALHLLDEIVPLTIEIADRWRLVRVLNLRGLVNEGLGAYELGVRDYEQAAEVAAAIGDDGRLFEVRTNAAASLLKQGLPGRGVVAFLRLRRQADATGSVHQRIAARNNLGTAYDSAGQWSRAFDEYDDAYRLAEANGLRPNAITLAGLSTAASKQGRDDVVHAVNGIRLAAWTEQGDVNTLVQFLLSGSGELADFDEATVLEPLFTYLLEEHDPLYAFPMAMRLADYRQSRGDPVAALSALDRALVAFASVRARSPLAISLEVRAADLEFDSLDRPGDGMRRLETAVAGVESHLLAAVSTRDGDEIQRAARPLYDALVGRLLTSGADPAARTRAFDVLEAGRPSTWSVRNGSPSRDAVVDQARVMLVRLAEEGSNGAVALVTFVETGAAVGAFVLRSDDLELKHVAALVTCAHAQAAASEFGVAANGDPERFPPRRPLNPAEPFAIPLPMFDTVMRQIGALAAHLTGVGLTCVVPSPAMSGLPIAAAVAPDGRYLVQSTAILTAPSAATLIHPAAEKSSHAPLSVFVAGVAAAEDEHPEFFEDDATIFEELAVTSVAGPDATAQAVLDGIRTADIAHVTCHGYVDLHDPLRSGLLLGDGAQRPSRRLQAIPYRERGRFQLPVQRLRDERIDTELITLRACSTARRSRAESNEEVATLLEALLAAGCRSVITAAWNVDQLSSRSLLSDFYAAYFKRESAPRALAQAQRALIRDGGAWSHPYHWAAFLVSGRGGRL